MGIRSFPKEGLNAEKFLRDAYIAQLTRLGGQVLQIAFIFFRTDLCLDGSPNVLLK